MTEPRALAELTRPIAGIENRTPAEVFDIMCDRIKYTSHSPEPSGETGGTQIAMGHGLVDVGQIHFEGRKGVILHPRSNHIPVGDEGELQGAYWPVEGDVVIWIDQPEGADVILKELLPFTTQASPKAPTEVEPVAFAQYYAPTGDKELEWYRHGAGRLTKADKEAGWTETPLYASLPQAEPAGDLVERVARAIEDAQPGHHLKLIDLTDGVSTYRVTVGDEGPRDFVGVDAYSQASEYLTDFTRMAGARAAIAALRDHRLASQPTEVGEWRPVEILPHLKGLRRSPKYYPAIGELCRVSGPNCDDANGYTWREEEVLWRDDLFIITRTPGCWPTTTKLDLALFEPLPTTEAESGDE